MKMVQQKKTPKFLATQHVPNCCEGIDAATWGFDDVDELLAIDWIEGWLSEFDGIVYVRFCRSDYLDADNLMVENEDGTHWWVVAYVTCGSIDSLPLVSYKQRRNKGKNNGSNR